MNPTPLTTHGRAAAVLVALASATGCKASDPNRISAERGGTVVSEDGLLTLVFPPGALEQDTTIRIERGSTSDLPAEIRVLDLIDQVYRLEPEGTEFDVPVEATMVLEGFTPPTDGPIPAVLGFTYDDTHGFEPLGDGFGTEMQSQYMTVDAEAQTVAVVGTLRHFTEVAGTTGGFTWQVTNPPKSPQPVGVPFNPSPQSVFMKNGSDRAAGATFSGLRVGPIGVAPVATTSPPVSSVDGFVLHHGVASFFLAEPFRFSCTANGKGAYRFFVIAEANLPGGATPTPLSLSPNPWHAYGGMPLLDRGPDNAPGWWHVAVFGAEMQCGSGGGGGGGGATTGGIDPTQTGTDGDDGTGDDGGTGDGGTDDGGTDDGEQPACVNPEHAAAEHFLGGFFPHDAVREHCDDATPHPVGNQTQPTFEGRARPAEQEVDSIWELLALYGVLAPPGIDTRHGPLHRLVSSPGVGHGGPDLPCGESADRITLCPPMDAPWQGDAVILVNVVDAPIPFASPTYHYQYGFVFESDGDTASNYQPAPQYPGDFFQDTDLWFVATYAPGTGWEVHVTDARNGTFVERPSAARIVIEGNIIALVVPRDELAAEVPGYRHTSFRHTGDWGLEGGEWSGDVVPPVDEDLRTW